MTFGGNFYAVHGSEDPNVPGFLTKGHDLRRRYLPSLTRRIENDLSRVPKEQAYEIRGIGVITFAALSGLENAVGTGALRLGVMRSIAVKNPTLVETVLTSYEATVQSEVPPEYRQEALGVINGIRSKFPSVVSDVKEAAALLKVQLPGATT